MNQKETSSVNTSHQQQQSHQNKEESKLKSLLQGSYDYIHRETGKMIQKKLYKRAFQLLDQVSNQRKDLELSEMVMLNRRTINCINKILKNGLLKPDIDQDRPEMMLLIIQRGTQAIFELYKYLNLYIQKVMPNEMKGIVLEDVSHLTSSDEEGQERIKEHEVTVLFYKINEYEKPKKERTKKQAKEINIYEQEVSESSRIANMIVKTFKSLNIQFELDQYFYNLIELLLLANLVFKKANKPKVAYYYLLEAQRIARQMLDTQNPNLVNVCAKAKVYLSNYYYEISEYEESLKVAEEAIVQQTNLINLNSYRQFILFPQRYFQKGIYKMKKFNTYNKQIIQKKFILQNPKKCFTIILLNPALLVKFNPQIKPFIFFTIKNGVFYQLVISNNNQNH